MTRQSLKLWLLKGFIIVSVSFNFLSGYSQGEFLDKGTNGFGVNVFYSSNDGINGYGTGIGFSISGIVDLQFGIASTSFPEEVFGNDFMGFGLSPAIIIHALKQNEEIPISLKAIFSYGSYNYSGEILSNLGLTMKGSWFSTGLGIYHRLIVGSKTSIIPSIDLYYTTIKTITEDSNGDSVEEKDDFVEVQLYLPIAFDLPKEQVLHLTPQIAFSNGQTIYGVAIGFVLPFTSGR